MNFKKAIVLVLSIATIQAFAQKSVPEYAKGVKELLNNGEGSLNIDENESGLKYLLQADKIQPKHPEICYLIGKAYLKLKRPSKAVDYLQTASDANYDEKLLNFELAQACHSINKFDAAIAAYEKYKNGLKGKDLEKAPELQRLIQNCENGKILVAKPAKVSIKNLGKGLNSKSSDYMPLVSADESTIVFTSRRPGSTGGELSDEDSKPFEDIYFAEKKNDTLWGPAKNMGTNINTASHDNAVGISPNGQQIFIHIGNKKGLGDLYVSDLKGKVWQKPVSLGDVINTPTSNENSCSLTPDGKYMFFSSDRPGGQGGLDIWVSKKNEKGEWSTPINLGPKINTSYDEESPFIHADGKNLYFSSKGHNSMGGFDIFEVDINSETGEPTSEVVNVGYPFNSYADETFISWSADGLKAYISAVREGGLGDEDIYLFTRPKSEEATHVVVFRGKVKDATTKAPVGANITIIDEISDKVIATTTANSSTGKFLFVLKPGTDYGIEIDAPKHMFTSRNINVPAGNSFQMITDSIMVETPKTGHKANLNNIFFEDGKAKILETSHFELDKLVTLFTSHKAIKIQIGGHVFSEKDAESNMKLSEDRARAVVEYLKSKGIVAARLSAKPYGNTSPLKSTNAQNNNRIEIEVK